MSIKILVATISFCLSLSLFAQTKVVGRYRNYFSSRIELNADSSFKYTWHFDLSGSWTKGTWSFKNDTVYLQMISTYDTISKKNNDGTSADQLVLSVDETPERFTPDYYAGMGLSSGGQNISSHPEKLFLKREDSITSTMESLL